MNRRHFLKSLVAIPFLGFFDRKQTEPVIEATKQTIYFTPLVEPEIEAFSWNGQSWSQLKQEKELDEVITNRPAIWNDNSWEAYRNGSIKFDSDGEIHIFETGNL